MTSKLMLAFAGVGIMPVFLLGACFFLSQNQIGKAIASFLVFLIIDYAAVGNVLEVLNSNARKT